MSTDYEACLIWGIELDGSENNVREMEDDIVIDWPYSAMCAMREERWTDGLPGVGMVEVPQSYGDDEPPIFIAGRIITGTRVDDPDRDMVISEEDKNRFIANAKRLCEKFDLPYREPKWFLLAAVT